MRELVPLTNAIAARMITSALSGCGGNHAILGSVQVSVPTAANAAAKAAALNAQTITAAKSPARARAATSPNDRAREHHSAPWLPAVV